MHGLLCLEKQGRYIDSLLVCDQKKKGRGKGIDKEIDQQMQVKFGGDISREGWLFCSIAIVFPLSPSQAHLSGSEWVLHLLSAGFCCLLCLLTGLSWVRSGKGNPLGCFPLSFMADIITVAICYRIAPNGSAGSVQAPLKQRR